VAFMGVAFLVTAVRLGPDPSALVRGTVLPSLPSGSALLVMGLIGTTVVPYNLFLGSGIAKGQTLGELRFGLGVAVVLGGVISMAVLVVGTAVDLPLTFEAVGGALRARLGGWAESFFAFGLLAAGLSSAITAPLAAAVSARGLLERRDGDAHGDAWQERSWRFRLLWLLVLVAGGGFGLADVRPIPAIILAQALNGLLLPFVAAFLLLVVNDVRLMGPEGRNGPFSNVVMGIVVVATVILGARNVVQAVAALPSLGLRSATSFLVLVGVVVTALTFVVGRARRSRRRAR
jgi:manganese transport protein